MNPSLRELVMWVACLTAATVIVSVLGASLILALLD